MNKKLKHIIKQSSKAIKPLLKLLHSAIFYVIAGVFLAIGFVIFLFIGLFSFGLVATLLLIATAVIWWKMRMLERVVMENRKSQADDAKPPMKNVTNHKKQ